MRKTKDCGVSKLLGHHFEGQKSQMENKDETNGKDTLTTQMSLSHVQLKWLKNVSIQFKDNLYFI